MPTMFSKQVPQDAGLAEARASVSSSISGGPPLVAIAVGRGAEAATPAKRKRQTRKSKGSPGNVNGDANGTPDDVDEEVEEIRDTPGGSKAPRDHLDLYGNPKMTWSCYKMPELLPGQVALPQGTQAEPDGDVCRDCELKCQAYPYQPLVTTLREANDPRKPGQRRKFDAMAVPDRDFEVESWNRQNLCEVLGIWTNITTHRIWMSITEFRTAYGRH